MNFEEFVKVITEKIKSYLGDGYTVRTEEELKNNDTEVTMLSIQKDDERWGFSTGLNYYYDLIQTEETKLEALVDGIIAAYVKARFEDKYDIMEFLEWDKVKENIYFKLINTEQNKSLLSNAPSREFKDLSIVYYVFVETEFSYGLSGSIMVRNPHLELWEVDEETLYEVASRNMKEKEEMVFQNIVSYIGDISGDEFGKDLNSVIPIYVLRNKQKMFGAARMTDMDILDQIAKDFDSDFIVLPSSIHEVIILPISEAKNLTLAAQMVKETNETMVLREETLSDHIYRFYREERKLEIVA